MPHRSSSRHQASGSRAVKRRVAPWKFARVRAKASAYDQVIRVLLAEGQLMFRTAVRRLLQLEEDIEVIAEVGRGDEVVHAALPTRPDVAVVDIEMPGQDGLSAASELRQRLPSSGGCSSTRYVPYR